MKKLLALIFTYFCLFQSTLSAENLITDLVINNSDSKEIEVLAENNQIYVPCKYFLGLFEVNYKENHLEKSLSAKSLEIKNNQIYINGEKQRSKVFFVKNGISGLKDEYFVRPEILAKLLNQDINANEAEMVVYLNSDKFKVTEENNDKGFDVFSHEKRDFSPKAYSEVESPLKSGWITLDTVTFNNNLMSDSYSQIYKETQSKNVMFNNNMTMNLKGKLNSGEYSIDMGTNSYSTDLLSFSGISPKYKNTYKKFDYVLAKVDPWEFGKTSINSDILGLQIKDHVENLSSYSQLSGFVAPTSTVKVYVNDDFEKQLSTYDGEYSLSDISYSKPIFKIRVEELCADGSKKDVLIKEFKEGKISKNLPKRDLILGFSGLQKRLWANNGTIYNSNTKKAVIGMKYRKDISNKLSFEQFLMADNIISIPQDTIWARNVLSNRTSLNFNTFKNYNMLDGQTYMGTFNYINSPKLTSELTFGVSNSNSKDHQTRAGPGVSLNYNSEYSLDDNNRIAGSAFYYDPNFYLAGNSGNSMGLSDRAGVSLDLNKKVKKVSIKTKYSKYASNMDNYFQGGLIDVDEFSLSSNIPFKIAPSLNLRANARKGTNSAGTIGSGSFELSTNKRIKSVGINSGLRQNYYESVSNIANSSSYNSNYSDIFTNIDFPVGRKYGTINLEHEMINVNSSGTEDKYNIARIAYATPTFKSISGNVMCGLHYTGLHKGFDLGLGLAKRLKSGSCVSFNYRYNVSPGYMIDNAYMPSTARQSVTVDFSELYGVSDNKLQAIGMSGVDKGLVQVLTFLDINQNGKMDSNEVVVDNVPIKFDNTSDTLLTRKNGYTKCIAGDEGIHKVAIAEDELPTFLSVPNNAEPQKLAKVKKNEKTRVCFGLISSVGVVNGIVTVQDEFNNYKKISELVVTVLDQENKEVSYTTVNEDGSYSITGLSPGKYTVAVDKDYQTYYNIVPDKDSEKVQVEIPMEYRKYVNIDNVNLNYINKL